MASITTRIAPAGATRQVGERAMHHVVAAEPAEHQAEQRRADQDGEDHRGGLRRLGGRGYEIAGMVHLAQRSEKPERERRHHGHGERKAKAVAQIEQRAQDHQHGVCAEAERDGGLRAVAAQRREQHGADRADGGCFGGRREPDQDRAEHHDDQQAGATSALSTWMKAPSPGAVSRIGGTAAGRTIATAMMNTR
jgi:hypothetical protein